ncbi:ATP-binding protein [Kocuria aegyptia]|uniref:LuxR family transcriptional regulator n=1 Tax=Kocuria aegyptia TaxID=330943 RepID=A0ABP4WIF6_9MICC
MIQGRQQERAAITALIEQAQASRGGALVVRGLPGVGKSVLLEDAAAGTQAVQVLRTRGVESESPLAFAALHRLLRPLLAHIGQLPAPQAHALRAAFGEITAEGVDRFLVFLAVLSLLAEAAEHCPVLAVVDDAQWLDDVSAAALLFVARRLDAERVALLFGARDGDERRFDSGDLPELNLTGLDTMAAAELLERQSGTAVPADVVRELTASTGGNPLALVELARSLTPEQLAGTSRLPRPLPLTTGVERAFLDRCRRLSEAAQTFLLVAAADDTGRLTTVCRAAHTLGAGDESLDVAEASGLLRIAGGHLELRHPLVRSAVYGAATDYRRRRVHQALAEVLTGEDATERRVWHLAAAAQGPDPAVAAQLDEVAHRSRSRGGHEAASAAWERAAELTTAAERRAELLYEAAQSAYLAGQITRARTLNETVAAVTQDPGLRADAVRRRARIEWNTGSLQLGHHMILQGAQEVAGADPARALEMGMFAAAVATFGGDSGIDIRPTTLIPEPATTAPARVHCFWHLLVGLDHIARGDINQGVPALRAAFADKVTLEGIDQDLLPNLGIAALHLGDDHAARHYHDLLLSRARSTGALVMVLYALTRRNLTDIAVGDWATARAGATEALQLAQGIGQPGLMAFPHALLALLDALQGQETYLQHLAATEQIVRRHPTGIVTGIVHDLLHWAKAVTGEDPASTQHHLAQMRLPMVCRQAAIDRVETAVRAGHPDQARAWVDDVKRFAEATGTAWPSAAALHGQALLTDGPETETYYRAALDCHQNSSRVFDRARTQLAYGEYLRRIRRRVDARAPLQAALETFTDLGAIRWEQRATQELRASGRTARRRSSSTTVSLTPQELQVAALIQQGMTNREAAAHLFLSPRTIDFHLRNVYAKLGVSSRSELICHPLDASPLIPSAS